MDKPSPTILELVQIKDAHLNLLRKENATLLAEREELVKGLKILLRQCQKVNNGEAESEPAQMAVYIGTLLSKASPQRKEK